MSKFKITTPVKGYEGVTAGVSFVNGAAEAELSEHLQTWFSNHGYELYKLEEEVLKPKELKDYNKEELIEMAKELGLEFKSSDKKDKIVEAMIAAKLEIERLAIEKAEAERLAKEEADKLAAAEAQKPTE